MIVYISQNTSKDCLLFKTNSLLLPKEDEKSSQENNAHYHIKYSPADTIL